MTTLKEVNVSPEKLTLDQIAYMQNYINQLEVELQTSDRLIEDLQDEVDELSTENECLSEQLTESNSILYGIRKLVTVE